MSEETPYDLLDGHRVENAVYFALSDRYPHEKPKEPVALRNFRSTYPQASRGILISRDWLSLPAEPTSPWIIPVYLLEFMNLQGFE
ncbi:MAG: hypothetical protein SNJ78_12875 [Spirochaetales bacterium]